ncbi:MAG: VWA domain-containing protein [Polyangiaceae bacterium]|nr:VWA domain-containing protein [Polyangiaceae bacterium]
MQATHAKPSNVAMFFTVDGEDGQPVGGLTAESFRIYEDDQLVSITESRQTILNPEVAAEHFTMLLVDMSGSVTESDAVPLIADAAAQFTASVEAQQQVGVYAFDGSADIHEIQPFRRARSGASGGVGSLRGFRTRDPSTNLNGAIVQAVRKLDEAMASSESPLTFGTLVVFSDGSDRAARVSQRDMNRALRDAAFDVFAIGVGTEIDEETLSKVGLTGYVLIEDTSAVTEAFTAIGQRILAQTKRFYLLSYCSPARAGRHEVTVEAIVGESTGSTSYEFDATDFGPDCDPNRPPEFEAGDDAQRQWRVRRGGRGGAVRIDVN